MSTHEILTGARAVLRINNVPVGVFARVSWSVAYDAAPAYVLGRYSAAEITYTGAEIVSVDAVGFRIIGRGAHQVASLPKLQELLNHDSISLSIVDRRTGEEFFKVYHVRPVGYSSDVAPRSQSELSVRFIGIRAEDESGAQEEAAGAVSVPSFP